MRALSYWAYKHPKQARVILGIGHVLAVALALGSGVLYYLLGFSNLHTPVFIAGNIFFALYAFYPKVSQKDETRRTNYVRRKLHDFGLVTCSWIVLSLGLCNSLAQTSENARPTSTAEAVPVVHQSKHLKKKSFLIGWWSCVKSKIKKFKAKLKSNLHLLKMAFSAERNGWIALLKIFLVLLTLTGAWFLGYLIAALSCSLSCSGQQGMAWTVLLLGWGSIAWLTFIALKAIVRMKSKEEMKKASTS